MLHKIQNWILKGVESPETLACMLTEFTWPLCQAMRMGEYVISVTVRCASRSTRR